MSSTLGSGRGGRVRVFALSEGSRNGFAEKEGMKTCLLVLDCMLPSMLEGFYRLPSYYSYVGTSGGLFAGRILAATAISRGSWIM